MTSRILLGMLTPSSNTVLEPVTTALIGDGSSSRVGAGEVLVAELDESDASLPLHHPRIAVVTSVEFDHGDYFEDLAAVQRCFRAFLDGLPRDGLAILCADDPWLRQMRTAPVDSVPAPYDDTSRKSSASGICVARMRSARKGSAPFRIETRTRSLPW